MRKNEVPEKVGKDRRVDCPRIDLHIPFLGGRPGRESAIDQDDLINLKIALYTSKTLEALICAT